MWWQALRKAPIIGSSVQGVRAALRSMDHRLGRRIFRDDDRLSHHARSRLVLRRIRARAGAPAPGAGLFSPDLLHERGIVPLPPLIPPDVIARLRTSVTAAFDDIGRRIPRQGEAPDGNVYSWYLGDLDSTAPDIEALLPPGLVESLGAYYGSQVNVSSVKCWRNEHVPDAVQGVREVNSTRWHCDSRRQPGLLKLFYLVHDVTVEHGPFQIKSRPQTRELFRMGYGSRADYRLPDSVLEDPEGLFTMTGSAGTAVLCDTVHCLHRAARTAPGYHRDIIQLQLLPASAPIAAGWLDTRRARIGVSERTTRYYEVER